MKLLIFKEDCKRLVISCHDCCRAKNTFLKNLPSRMSKQPPPWFNKMPIVSHWNIKQKTEYFLKQSVSLVQNMVCLHRFVLGRSSKDGVSSYASPDGPFQHRGNCPRVQEQSIPDQRQGGTVQPILSRNRRQRIHPNKNMKKQCKKLEMIHRMYVQMMMIYDK